MPELVLHALPPSHPCMTAEVALQLKGLAYERIDLAPGEHTAKMAEIYGEGRTTVPGLLVDGEPVHGSRPILARLEALEADPPLYPEPIAGRGPRGRALGRRGAAGPRPPAALGRAALPARGAGHLRRRRRRWTRPAPTSRSGSSARAGSTTASPRERLAERPRRAAGEARPRRRARRGGHDRRRGAQRRRPADRRHAARPALPGRPAAAAGGPRGRAHRPRVVPGLPRATSRPGRSRPGGSPRAELAAELLLVAAGDDRGPLDRLARLDRPRQPHELRVRPRQRGRRARPLAGRLARGGRPSQTCSGSISPSLAAPAIARSRAPASLPAISSYSPRSPASSGHARPSVWRAAGRRRTGPSRRRPPARRSRRT